MASAISLSPVPSLRARPTKEATRRIAAAPPVRAASLRDTAAVGMVAAAATSLVLAGGAAAMEVKLGGDDGSLAFVPQEFSVAAGEKITFKNNAGFPHNVIFDEDEIPAGVNVGEISMQEEDLLNAAGDEFSVVLKEKGTYSFYCAPHQGAGMVGKVTVN